MREKINGSFSIDVGLNEKLGVIAKRMDRTRSYLVNKMIKEFIEKNS